MNSVVPTGRCLLWCGLLTSVLILSSCATTDRHTVPLVQTFRPYAGGEPAFVARDTTTLRVMTLNLAHGRGDGLHQLLQDSETTLANLANVVALIHSEKLDIVALQEADAPSFWSGNFDHVGYLATHGPLRQSVHGRHAEGIGLAYGTALLARLNLQQPEAVTFDPTFSPTPKGFVVSTIAWPGMPCLEVDVVSVHLEFSSETLRRQQAEELIQTLRLRDRPLILMGDFNSEWRSQNSTVQFIARAMGLVAFQPGDGNFETFPSLNRRLDWILVSPQLEFRTYHVLPQVVSDHKAVVAELSLWTRSRLTSSQDLCHPGPDIDAHRADLRGNRASSSPSRVRSTRARTATMFTGSPDPL